MSVFLDPETNVHEDDRGDGFAETRNIRNELVFYFEEFLTPCGKNMRERKETWNGNIRRAALKLTELTFLKNALPTNLYRASKHIPITLPLPIRWSASVIRSLPYAPVGDVTMIVRRRYIKVEERYDDEDPPFNPAMFDMENEAKDASN